MVNLLPFGNAVLKLKHNYLLSLTLTCATSGDLNPVYYAFLGAFQEMVYRYRSFRSVQELKSAILSQRSNNCHKRFLSEVSVNENVVQCNGAHIEYVC